MMRLPPASTGCLSTPQPEPLRPRTSDVVRRGVYEAPWTTGGVITLVLIGALGEQLGQVAVPAAADVDAAFHAAERLLDVLNPARPALGLVRGGLS